MTFSGLVANLGWVMLTSTFLVACGGGSGGGGGFVSGGGGGGGGGTSGGAYDGVYSGAVVIRNTTTFGGITTTNLSATGISLIVSNSQVISQDLNGSTPPQQITGSVDSGGTFTGQYAVSGQTSGIILIRGVLNSGVNALSQLDSTNTPNATAENLTVRVYRTQSPPPTNQDFDGIYFGSYGSSSTTYSPGSGPPGTVVITNQAMFGNAAAVTVTGGRLSGPNSLTGTVDPATGVVSNCTIVTGDGFQVSLMGTLNKTSGFQLLGQRGTQAVVGTFTSAGYSLKRGG